MNKDEKKKVTGLKMSKMRSKERQKISRKSKARKNNEEKIISKKE